MVTEWKDLKGFEGLYKISKDGEIFGLRRNKLIRPRINRYGYIQVYLTKNKKTKTLLVHRLVLLTFTENKDNFPVVNHLNGVKNDNRIENLEWCTDNENNTHRYFDKPKTSKYVGVQWHKAAQKWISKICIKQKRIHLGVFENEKNAHLAYLSALNQYKITNKYSSETR